MGVTLDRGQVRLATPSGDPYLLSQLILAPRGAVPRIGMPYLQLNEKRYPLRVGETRVGSGAGVEVPVQGPAQPPVQAIVDVTRENQVVIRRMGNGAAVRVNGVQLGVEPTPLIHGDKIEIGDSELFYGDDRRGGSTQFISSVSVPDLQKLRAPAPGKATAATGGRIISLVDGREYLVPPAGLTFGRDAGCDVVIPSSEVSRRHAEVVPGDVGYVLSDTSTNGVFVNGTRIEAMQVLGRGDVFRIGGEEFRFYADVLQAAPEAVAPAAPAPAVVSAPPAVSTPAAVAAPAAIPASARAVPSASAPIPAPVSAPASAPAAASTRPPLATLEVVGGSSGVPKGRIFPVTSVLAHVGRGSHNDVVIFEESVSDSHAKLQRREGVWYVSDLGSTNGTYVNGRRITAEERLAPDTDLRFGGVKLVFHVSATEPTTEPKALTRQFGVPDTRRPVGAPAAGTAPAAPRPRPREQYTAPAPVETERGGVPWWAWLIALLAIGGAGAYLFLSSK
jgi:pSer/pThr/pTyr-binding forkhead associated (FHA) protein